MLFRFDALKITRGWNMKMFQKKNSINQSFISFHHGSQVKYLTSSLILTTFLVSCIGLDTTLLGVEKPTTKPAASEGKSTLTPSTSQEKTPLQPTSLTTSTTDSSQTLVPSPQKAPEK